MSADIFHWPLSNGQEVCRYADHVAALAGATRSKERVIREAEHYRRKGYEAGLTAARDAVAAAFAKDSPTVQSQTEWGASLALAAINALIHDGGGA